MGAVNRALDERIETYFLMSRIEYAYLSSSIVRELAYFGRSTEGLVPPSTARRLQEKFSKP
jgi:pantetheine-phosphate adenylyltransferase